MPIVGRSQISIGREPRWPFTVNWGSPQAEGLVGWWPLHKDIGFKGLVGPGDLARQTAGAGVFSGAKDLGQVWLNTSASKSTLIATATAGITNLSAGTWVVRYKDTTNTDAGVFGAINGENGSAYNYLAVDHIGTEATDPRLYSNVRVGAAKTQRDMTGWASGAIGVMNTIGYSYNGAEERLYGNYTTQASAKTGSLWGNTEYGIVLAGVYDTAAANEGFFADIRIYDHALPPDVFFAIHDPATRWDLFYELGRRQYYFVPAAGGATGTGALTLSGATIAAQGVMQPEGTAALALANATLAASGEQPYEGTAALALANATLAAQGVMQPEGTAAVALANATLAATGAQSTVGTAALALSSAVVAATGSQGQPITGTAVLTLARATLAAQGVEDAIGTAALLLAAIQMGAQGSLPDDLVDELVFDVLFNPARKVLSKVLNPGQRSLH